MDVQTKDGPFLYILSKHRRASDAEYSLLIVTMTEQERRQIAQMMRGTADLNERLANVARRLARDAIETADISAEAALQSKAQARFVEQWGTEPSGNGATDE